jgi:hypothetical protein
MMPALLSREERGMTEELDPISIFVDTAERKSRLRLA